MKTIHIVKTSMALLVFFSVFFGGISSALAQSDSSAETAQLQPTLTASQIQRAMSTERYETRECVFRSADSLPMEVNLTVEVVITPAGLVRTASMFESNSENEEVDQCVVDLVRDIQFPSSSATLDSIVRYRYIFVTGSSRG